jgi:predicted Zn-dependent peptidase
LPPTADDVLRRDVLRREIFTHACDNGLVLLAEPAQSVQSAAFTLLVPCGYAREPADRQGLAGMVCDMTLRGAGDRDSRAVVNALEALGVERGESVGATQTSFSGATVASHLNEALAIYADIVQRPRLPADQLDAARQVCLQEIRSVHDEPAQLLMTELRRRTYPKPWGRSSHGDEAGVRETDLDDVRGFWQRSYRPNGAILGVAGNFRWDELRATVERLFADWRPQPTADPEDGGVDDRPAHVPFESNQCHIGIAFPSVTYRDPEYFKAWAAVGVLSSGMSSRLFTEVREKRGLCYTVSASLQTHVDRAAVFCHAGTTLERAQETLDVTYGELVRLGQGIEPGELARLKARIKSSLIMQQESTSARSGALARDWRHLGRVRTLDEVGQIVDGLAAESINAFLAAHPPRDFTFATLGPEPLRLPPAA